MNDAAREERRLYYREWAKRNRDKLAANQERYWSRKAAKRQGQQVK